MVVRFVPQFEIAVLFRRQLKKGPAKPLLTPHGFVGNSVDERAVLDNPCEALVVNGLSDVIALFGRPKLRWQKAALRFPDMVF